MALQTEPLRKQLFTVKETAAILNTSPNVIYKLLKMGDLKALKLPENKIPDFEIERFKHWAFKEEIDYSDILKEKRKIDDKKIQVGNNPVGIGSAVNRYS